MNDRLTSVPGGAVADGAAVHPDPTLPPTTRLGAFEIQRLIARSASTAVYLATDHALAMPVAIQEYLPARMMRRDAGLHLRTMDAWHDDVVARGLRAFIDETQLLAHCDHPALVRITQLFESRGSAYRVMPVYSGQRLAELRHEMVGAPDESALRGLLSGLLGAIEAIHRSGRVHGGISPTNILLLADDRPLLLGPGAAGHEIGSDLVDSLMATLEVSTARDAAGGGTGVAPTGAARDLYMLADTLRFCITGEVPAAVGTLRVREPLAEAIQREFETDARPHYSATLLGALDAALSPFAEDRPLTAAQFREWLDRGVPGGARRMPPAAAPMPATTGTPPSPSYPPVAALASETTQPMRSWHGDDAPPPPLDDPITPDRPPWVPPPLPPELQRSAAPHRRYKVMMAIGLAALAVMVLAVTTGAWNTAPDIRLDTVVDRPVSAAPQQSAPAPATLASASTPAPEAAPVEPAPVPLPATTTTAAAAAAPSEPIAQGAVLAPALEPAAEVATHPPAAAPRTPARVERSTTAALAVGGPRAACAGRTEFALYRCVLQQCQARRWVTHPQCVKLRREDRVD